MCRFVFLSPALLWWCVVALCCCNRWQKVGGGMHAYAQARVLPMARVDSTVTGKRVRLHQSIWKWQGECVAAVAALAHAARHQCVRQVCSSKSLREDLTLRLACDAEKHAQPRISWRRAIPQRAACFCQATRSPCGSRALVASSAAC